MIHQGNARIQIPSVQNNNRQLNQLDTGHWKCGSASFEIKRGKEEKGVGFA